MPLEERRAQIVEAALSEFLEKGFEDAKIDSIAEAIGVSKPVLYGAFDSKEAIAVAAVEEAHRREAEMNIEADELHSYSLLAEGKVTPLFELIFRLASQEPRLFGFLYSDFRSAPPQAVAFHDQVFEIRTIGLVHHLSIFFAGRPGGRELAVAAAEMISSVGRRGLLKVARGEVDDTEELAALYGGLIERGIQSY